MAVMEDDKKAEAAPEVPSTGTTKKASIIKWALVGSILLLFIGMDFGIAWIIVRKINPPAVNIEDEEAKKQKAYEEAQKEADTSFGPIDITVNINGEEGRFLKCGVQLGYSTNFLKLGEELEARKVRIKDIIIDVMSSRSLNELMTNEGKQSVRKQIVEDVNKILPDKDEKGKDLGKVSRSYFDSFMIQ